MAGKPAGIYRGNCSGHGKCNPGVVHASVPCFGGCAASPKKPVAAMDAYSQWAPLTLAPKTATEPNVLINGIAPIKDEDILTEHPSQCAVKVIDLACPKAKESPTTLQCNTTEFCCSDDVPGIGHQRVAKATSKTVKINGKFACRVGDQFKTPCLSKIPAGSANVNIGG